MRISLGLITGVVFAALSLGQAQAAISGLYGTGVDVSGGIDQAWTVGGGSAYVIADPGSVGWIGNTLTSAWISNDPSTYGGGGPFTYATTFSGAGDISGFIAADDQATIYLNGNLVFTGNDTSTDPWSYFQSFQIDSGFVTGLNTLTVFVPNNIDTPNDGPTGLQIGISAVPEPSTWALMALGFASLGFAGYRRTKRKGDEAFSVA